MVDIDRAMTAANEIRRRATAMKDSFEEEKPGSRRNATATALMRCRMAADSIETLCDDLVIQLWAYQQAAARGRRMDKLVQSMQKAARTDEGRKKPEESDSADDEDYEEDAWDDL